MPFVPLRDGQRLHVRVIGRGQPVLMLPGLGMQSLHWLPFVLPHVHRFRFYLPDFRGAGRSAGVRFNQPDVFQNHMEDVADLIAHFGLDDFLLAGLSLGGSTSLHLLQAGGFAGVRRYLHIDQSPCVGNRDDWPHGLFGARQDAIFTRLRQVLALLSAHPEARHLDQLPTAVRREVADVLSEVAGLMAGRQALVPVLRRLLLLPGMAARLLPLSNLDDARAYLAAYTSGGHDYRAALRECPVPVTVMVGMRSPLYPPPGQMAIAALAPRGTVVRFERSGHVPLTDEPLRFAREFRRFLHGED